MKRREDIYNVGNDYFQVTSAYFVTDDTKAAASAGIEGYKAYSDGLFHFTKEPVYELSGGSAALNKRVFNKLPQSTWATDFDTVPAGAQSAFSAINDASAVFSPDYATIEDPTDNDWSKTPGGK